MARVFSSRVACISRFFCSTNARGTPPTDAWALSRRRHSSFMNGAARFSKKPVSVICILRGSGWLSDSNRLIMSSARISSSKPIICSTRVAIHGRITDTFTLDMSTRSLKTAGNLVVLINDASLSEKRESCSSDTPRAGIRWQPSTATARGVDPAAWTTHGSRESGRQKCRYERRRFPPPCSACCCTGVVGAELV